MDVRRSNSDISENSTPQAPRFSTMHFFSSVKRRVANEVSEFFFLPTNSDDKKWRERTKLLHARNPIYRNLGLTLRRKRHLSLSHPPHAMTSDSFASFMQSETPSRHHSSILLMPPANAAVSLSSIRPVSQAEQAFRPLNITGADETNLSFPESNVQKSSQRLPRRMQCRETVLEMAYNAVHSLNFKQSHQQPQKPCHRRSFQRNLIYRSKPDQKDPHILENPDFFNTPIPTSYPLPIRGRDSLSEGAPQKKRKRNVAGNLHPHDEVDHRGEHRSHATIQFYQPQPKTPKIQKNGVITVDPTAAYFVEYEALDQVDGAVSIGMSKFAGSILTLIQNNTNRKVGVGIVGDCLNWDQKDIKFDPDVQKQIDDISSNPYRPYFTFWVTFVQIVCFIFAISVYGISTIGVSETIVQAEVLTKSLSIEKVYYIEEDNMWIGPRQADLVHLGARFSPCMRKDANIDAAMFKDRQMENLSACCVLNDGSGCFQSDKSSCSETLANWLKWNGSIESQFRHSGSVCGLDPSFCLNPQSLPPFVWPDEIISWPICKLTSPSLNISSKNQQNARTLHMTCPIVGRPCCYGIQGQCIITTREHCTFLRGFFHADLFLCAQVSCMAEICAMLPFVNPDQPDQFYRLFTSLLFMQAKQFAELCSRTRIFQLLISILFQIFIMRDFEKLGGWLRVGIIYVVSGIGGSLASAIFVPYHVEAGPSGSLFSIIACCFTDIVHNWNVLPFPGWALGKLSLIVVVLFVLGLLPMIDNYAHLFGFIFGFLLSFALLPYVTFSLKDARNKRIGVIVCLVISVCLFNVLVVFFYVSPVNSCPNCHYFNCIPLTENFCKSVEMKIRYYSL